MSTDEVEWQKLCKLIADERDPQRLLSLVDQLIEALVARRNTLRAGTQPGKPASGPATGKD
jgi:hypothetical protein